MAKLKELKPGMTVIYDDTSMTGTIQKNPDNPDIPWIVGDKNGKLVCVTTLSGQKDFWDIKKINEIKLRRQKK